MKWNLGSETISIQSAERVCMWQGVTTEQEATSHTEGHKCYIQDDAGANE